MKHKIVMDFKTALPKLDHNRRVALEYFRDGSVVRYLAFESQGLQTLTLPVSEFDARFKQRLLTPVGDSALHMLRSSRDNDYCPGDGVHSLLLEIYTMARTDSTNDLDGLDLKGLTTMYNELAKAVSLPTVKSFKDKPTARKRIEALRTEAAKPSEKQTARLEAKAEKSDVAKSVFSKVADTVTGKKSVVTKAPAKKVPAKAEAPKKGSTKDKKVSGRGLGIGAFCNDLILKGKSNEDVLTAVRTKFPGAATSASSVAWYRNKLKSDGLLTE